MKLAVLLAVLGAVAIAAAVPIVDRGSSGTGLVGPPAGPFRGSVTPPNVHLPAFALEEWNGRRIESQALRGKVVVVTFLETKCDEACPIIADQIDLGLRRLTIAERGRVYALAISTHPTDDTRANVRRFLRAHRVLGQLHYLIGSEKQLRPVWRSFHILSALDSGDADAHSAPVRIFSPAGRWVSTLHAGVDLTPTNLAHDVRVALRGS